VYQKLVDAYHNDPKLKAELITTLKTRHLEQQQQLIRQQEQLKETTMVSVTSLPLPPPQRSQRVLFCVMNASAKLVSSEKIRETVGGRTLSKCPTTTTSLGRARTRRFNAAAEKLAR
jgi:hypothetical protein